MDSEALVADTRSDPIQQRQRVVGGKSSHVEVVYGGNFIRQGCQLVEMCGKQAEGTNLGGYVTVKYKYKYNIL